MNAVPQMTPVSELAEPPELSDLVARIIVRDNEIAEIRASISRLYAEAEVLGAHKAGLKLRIKHARMTEEKLAKIADGYARGSEALGAQGRLVF